jgi:hypothetical protein
MERIHGFSQLAGAFDCNIMENERLMMILGGPVNLGSLGLPGDWCKVESWLSGAVVVEPVPETCIPKIGKKDWGLTDYVGEPPKGFWDSFPSRQLPRRPCTRINVPVLKKLCSSSNKQWTVHQAKGAERTITALENGAPAYQSRYLRPMLLSNAPSVLEYGNIFTTTLSEWIDKGFVAGPFLNPPVQDFRANSLMAEAQKDKVRPILNMSSPKGWSFNCNVNKFEVPRTYQSSARMFGQTLLEVGRDAIITKMDMRDAFKLVPAKVDDYRLQGFRWLNRYFIDTQQIFGSTPSVSNFDRLAETVLDIVTVKTGVPRQNVHRTLDDVVCVAQPDSGWCQSFSKTYRATCAQLDIPLADDCPKKEKAFTCETAGTVLGVQFRSDTLQWRMGEQKINGLLNGIHLMSTCGHADLKQTERLVGKLNNFGQMMPLLKTFRRPMNEFLASFGEDYDILLPVPEEFLRDLKIWYAVIADSWNWMNIPREQENPDTTAISFTSDAAGGLGNEEWAGVASLGHYSEKSFWFMCRGKWPSCIYWLQDEKGASFAAKMTTLELVGLFLPMLTVPDIVRGKNIILGVDNVSVVFAWENGSVAGDKHASVLVRALHLVSLFLECRVFVQHIPRLSTLSSCMADNLTRQSTATADVWAKIVGADVREPPEVLWRWLSNPTIDWNLGVSMINSLK